MSKELTENKAYEIEYDRWSHVVITAEFIIACVVCLIEIINNVLLYVTRSQGYGPDTIMQKLFRYLFITSFFNFGMVLLSKIVEKKVSDETSKRFFLMLFTTLMCTDVAFSHYQFSICIGIFVIPIVICILYEDKELALFTLIICEIGVVIAVVARGFDPLYNKDIGPEAAISIAMPISVFVFAKIINTTLINRRNELKYAVISAEKANAQAEKMAFSFKMLETLASTIDAKDKYTNGHSMRVATYSTILATALGWDEASVSKLRYEALLHDIGKIGVPDVILNKPAKLSDVEFGLIKSHTVIGSDILKNMVAVPNASEVAKYHHERFDGNGYPNGLKGEEIPINARIVCIADSFDAMSSDRIYRKALPVDTIRDELVRGRAGQFDPELLDIFLDLFDNHKLNITRNSVFKEDDSYEQYVMEDIEKVIGRLADMEERRTSATEFDKFYKYMRNIGLRYNRSIEVLSIDIVAKDGNNTFDANEISDVLQIAIRKNIRSVDVYYRYSEIRHMLILLDAGIENINVIQQRILFDFNSNKKSEGFELKFALNESIESPAK